MSFELSSLLLGLFGFGLCFVTISIIRSKSLFTSIILLSASSLMIMLCYLLMDAPDVAMTEAAIGVCLSTSVLLKFAKGYRHAEEAEQNSKLHLIPYFILGSIMIYAGFDLALYGEGAGSYISDYFLRHTGNEIGVPSFVAAILASYRGYDTLGETTVIFTAAMALSILLRGFSSKLSSQTSESISSNADLGSISAFRPEGVIINKDALASALSNSGSQISVREAHRSGMTPKGNIVAEVMVKFIAPFILFLAVYIQICGEISPGGGFQAGAIFASIAIGFYLAFPHKVLVNPVRVLTIATSVGLLIYASTGLLTVFLGSWYLDYYALAPDPHFAQKIGIFAIELGVGITVAAGMMLIYFLFDREAKGLQ